MSSINFRFFLLFFCVGCSVAPLYEENHPQRSCCNVTIDIIAERDGQILRRYLMDAFRDLHFQKRQYSLTIKLSSIEKSFAFASDGNAKRLRLYYTADAILKDSQKKILFRKLMNVSRSSNISSVQGEVAFSLYGRNSGVLLKELSDRIVENIKVFLSHEE
ncbi:MAG: hypothetical protein LBJ45_01815 [Holosporaceae bacterium]|jgi:hypothetical protein|nr:hypothetical protein [Holosporaceae bacterium]